MIGRALRLLPLTTGGLGRVARLGALAPLSTVDPRDRSAPCRIRGSAGLGAGPGAGGRPEPPNGPVSGGAAPDRLSRSQDRQSVGVPHQQLHRAGTDDCQLYRCRWQVELFFKWIKQYLRIKAFYGTSENAVRIQVWTAISVYVLVAIVKKRLCLSASPYTILQILSLSLFEKTHILQVLSQQPLPQPMPAFTISPVYRGF